MDARLAFKASTRPLCLFGHTHYPVTFDFRNGRLGSAGPSPDAESELDVSAGGDGVKGVKYLVNPGSVGQPRDGDPRAAYAIVDTSRRRVELLRVAYPVDIAQQKVLEAGLPEVLARRLSRPVGG